MTKKLIFLHTAPALVDSFDRLLSATDTEIESQHIVAEELLAEARRTGVTPELQGQIESAILDAAGPDGVVLCTCSSIGGPAEGANALMANGRVIRVDRPMAAKAVALGERILVAATLMSTMQPTIELIEDEAAQAGKEIDILPVLCESAWPLFASGDTEGYVQEVANTLRQHADSGDVIVLAQASMAAAAELCKDLPIPVLSSPQLGLDAALKLMT